MSSKRSETTYQKINTIFKRDEHNIIMPYDELTQPEFEYLRNLKWHCEEKVDGCLKSNTLIQMADGTRKQINRIKEGDYVLGYDVEDGEGVKVVKVQGVKKQKAAGTWVIVKTTRNGLDKGNESFHK